MTETIGGALARLAEAPPSGFALRVLERCGVVDDYALAEAPVGTVGVAHNRHGVSWVARAAGEDAFEADFVARFGRPLRRRDLPVAIGRALESGRSRGLDFDLRPLRAFERSVLVKTLEIPRGELRPYSWVAREIGHERADRAVGTALANNPIPLLIPCHRVVRRDGHIGNYGLGGPAVKRQLIRHEGLDPDALEALAGRGIRLVGSDSTGIVCLPTCRNARRISARHRLEMRGEAAALAAGLRPCMACRPFTRTAAET